MTLQKSRKKFNYAKIKIVNIVYQTIKLITVCLFNRKNNLALIQVIK